MIHLLDDYYVSVDGGSYTLLKKVNGKTKNGEPTEKKRCDRILWFSETLLEEMCF